MREMLIEVAPAQLRRAGRTLVEILYAHDVVLGPAMGMLRRYELQGCADQNFETLSGGQQARFQILLLELSGATLLLLDEPTAGLDAETERAFQMGFISMLGNVKVLHRAGKAGLGAAYRHGFQVAFDEGYDVIVEMDSDLSHDPTELPRLLEAAAASKPLPGRCRVLYVPTLDGAPVDPQIAASCRAGAARHPGVRRDAGGRA